LFTGVIFRDFTLKYPARILTGCDDTRSGAVPIAIYRVRKKNGCYCASATWEQGTIEVETLPPDPSEGSFTGSVSAAGAPWGTMKCGGGSESGSLLEIKPATGVWMLSLSKQNTSRSESDCLILDSRFGTIANLCRRRDESWKEQKQSTFGFGRVKQGWFVGQFDRAFEDGNTKVAFLGLLIVYFQVIEPYFNTDWPSG
jgi:hypothetical protein